MMCFNFRVIGITVGANFDRLNSSVKVDLSDELHDMFVIRFVNLPSVFATD